MSTAIHHNHYPQGQRLQKTVIYYNKIINSRATAFSLRLRKLVSDLRLLSSFRYTPCMVIKLCRPTLHTFLPAYNF